MIIGIGTDLVENARIKRACEKEAFLMRVFTEREREEIAVRQTRAAGDFAGKEAVAKLLGCGFSGIAPREIEVLRAASGQPFVTLYGNAAQRAQQIGVERIFLSISNTKEHTVATVVGEGIERNE